MVFDPPLDVARSSEGRAWITTYPEHGRISLTYRVQADEQRSLLEIYLADVEVPQQYGLIYHLVVNRFTTFGTWPEKYSYRAEIDLQTGANAAAWHKASADATGSDATE